MGMEVHPFGMFVPKGARYLLLGSFIAKMNNDASYDWFYSSKRNQFWPILEEVYGIELKIKSHKEELFSKLGIAMADIIEECERALGNSSDNNLVNAVYNGKLEKIFADNEIQKVFFSSRFVEKEFGRHFKDLVQKLNGVEFITLPSPSPRYAKMSWREKVERYREVLPKIKNG
jgi:hypoxanthine-DNA glycosylase